MRLAINAVGAKVGGSETMLQEVLEASEREPYISEVFVFCSPQARREFSLARWKKVTEVPQERIDKSLLLRMWWLEVGLAKATQRIHAHCLLSMTNTGIGPMGVPTALFVMQALPFSSEALAVCGTRLRFRMMVLRCMMRRSCTRAVVVFTQTPTMKSWLRSSFGLAEEKVVVTLPQLRAMSAEGDDRAVRGLMMAVPENRRLLYVGSDHAYKNVECACEAARRVQEIYPDTRLFVTLPFDHPLCDGKVILGLGYLRGSALRAAYELATVFVMPSLVECGNLTVLEAMSFGTPVLVADRPYARDTCEDAAVFFDPLRSEGLATQIVCLLGDVRQRTKMVDLGGALVERRQRGASYSTMISHLVSLAGRSGTPSGVTAEPEGRLRWRADL